MVIKCEVHLFHLFLAGSNLHLKKKKKIIIFISSTLIMFLEIIYSYFHPTYCLRIVISLKSILKKLTFCFYFIHTSVLQRHFY